MIRSDEPQADVQTALSAPPAEEEADSEGSDFADDMLIDAAYEEQKILLEHISSFSSFPLYFPCILFRAIEDAMNDDQRARYAVYRDTTLSGSSCYPVKEVSVRYSLISALLSSRC
jgi:hypothetical protein